MAKPATRDRFLLLAISLATAMVVLWATVFSSSPFLDSAEIKSCSETLSMSIRLGERRVLNANFPIQALVLDSSSNQIIVAGNNSEILITSWESEEYRPSTLGTTFLGFSALSIDKQSEYLVGGTTDGNVLLWRKSSNFTGEWEREYTILPGKHRGFITSVAVSDDAKRISASGEDAIFIWTKESDADGWKLSHEVYSAHSGTRVWSTYLNSTGTKLYSSGNDRLVKEWDITQDTINASDGIRLYNDEKPITSIVLSSDEQEVFVGNDNGKVKKVNLNSLENVESLKDGHDSQPVKSLVVSPSGNIIVSGSNDETVRAWNICTQEILNIFEGHEYWVSSVDIADNEQYIVSAGLDEKIIIWPIQITGVD